MKLLAFDLGLEHTAHVLLGTRDDRGPLDTTRWIELLGHGTITTSRDDTIDERIFYLCATVGEVVRDAMLKGARAVVGEAAPLGSSAGGFSGRSLALTFGVQCIVSAAAIYGGFRPVFYTPRTWQRGIGVPLEFGPGVDRARRRKVIKQRVEERVRHWLEGADLLRGEHEFDAAGVGLCHLLGGRHV